MPQQWLKTRQRFTVKDSTKTECSIRVYEVTTRSLRGHYAVTARSLRRHYAVTTRSLMVTTVFFVTKCSRKRTRDRFEVERRRYVFEFFGREMQSKQSQQSLRSYTSRNVFEFFVAKCCRNRAKDRFEFRVEERLRANFRREMHHRFDST